MTVLEYQLSASPSASVYSINVRYGVSKLLTLLRKPQYIRDCLLPPTHLAPSVIVLFGQITRSIWRFCMRTMRTVGQENVRKR